MKKLKKLLLSLACFALGAALTLVGTLAYLQDETDTAYNVMTRGNVKIEQLEYERATDEDGNWFVSTEMDQYGYYPDKLVPFTVGKPADPAVYNDGDIKWDDRNGNQNASGDGSHQQSWAQVGAPGSNQLFDDSVGNVVDHFVFVKNTGRNSAYYRTIIAIECPVGFDDTLIHLSRNGNSRFAWSEEFFTVIDGVRYMIREVTYTDILAPGEVSRPSLLQMFLDPATTNEQVALFGDTWDVLVVSQAVQSSGFENNTNKLDAEYALDIAFGDITATNTPWTRENDPQDATPPYVANTADELAGFLANGGSIVIAEDITIGSSMPVTEDTVLDLNGMTIDAAGTISGCPIMLKNGKLVVKNGTLNLDGAQTNINGSFHTAIGYDANTELVVDNVTFKGGTAINGTWNSDGPLKLTISNSTFDVSSGGIIVSAGSTEAYAIINNCNVKAGQYAIFASQGSKVTVNGGNYSAEKVITSMYAGTEVTVNGGYFDGKLDITSNGSLVVKGGTFTADPSAYVAEGYVVVENTVTRDATTTYTVLPIADEATFRLALDKYDTVKLMGNVAFATDAFVEITGNKTIDLNGYTITGLDTTSKSFGLINVANGAELTVNDTKGTGAIILSATVNSGWDRYSSVISNQRGTLTVNGGTIEHKGGTDMSYAIDNLTNTNADPAKTVINGGVIKSTYTGIRQFCNSATGLNELTINGGVISGSRRSVWMQQPNDHYNFAKLTINGGTLIGDFIIGSDKFDVTVYGSTYALSIEALQNALNNGKNVTIYKDTIIDEDIVIPADYNGTLSLADCTLKSITNNSATAKIVINGNVVINNENGSAITGEVINISGNGTLTAIANGVHAYGIGGDNTKTINISGITINEIMGGHAHGVGSDTGHYKDAPEGGAAIGSGFNGAEITLNKVHVVKAIGGSKSAGIGARYHTGVTVNIIDSVIDYVKGGVTAAGIGGSRVSSERTESGTTITIKNSTITAVGGVYGAGIGSGYDTHCNQNQPICTINIEGSTINATGGKYAAGVGAGYHNAGLKGEIKNSTVTATSGDKFYKASYTKAQDIGFGVVDPAREGLNNNSSIIFNGTVIAIPSV